MIGLGAVVVEAYRGITDLAHMYLTDSFVLDVTITPGTVVVTMDFVLEPGHPRFETPGRGHLSCFRRGDIVYEGVTEVDWSMPTVMPAIDALGERDHGGIDVYEVDGDRHGLVGDIGEIRITCAVVRVRFDE